MATTRLRDVWTHDLATDTPKTQEAVEGSLRHWLKRYRELPKDAQARKTLQPGYQDRVGAQDVIATKADLDLLLGGLSERQREAIIRCCIGGQSAGDAAVAMLGDRRRRGAVQALINTGVRDAARALIGT